MGEALTAPQKEQLRKLAQFHRYHISSRPTVKALIRRGLAVVNSYGVTSITPEGRALLTKDAG